MDKTTSRQASDILWAAWRAGDLLTTLPAAMQPANRFEGYAIQAGLDERDAGPLYGWKIAATSLAGQRHIGVTGPLAGRILSGQVLEEGASVSLRGNHMRLAECEFAFRMNATLAPRTSAYTQEEVLAAVASLHPAIELPDSRFVACEKLGEAMLIADNACAHQFMAGASSPAFWRNIDLAGHAVEATVSRTTAGVPGAAVQTHKGQGSNVLGDPRIALTWLVNELSALGLALAAGAVVTTGTCIVPIPVVPGDEVIVSFGELGSIRARFTD